MLDYYNSPADFLYNKAYPLILNSTTDLWTDQGPSLLDSARAQCHRFIDGMLGAMSLTITTERAEAAPPTPVVCICC